ncbi:MAG: hypothetical protein ABIH23_04995 [bacterium]
MLATIVFLAMVSAGWADETAPADGEVYSKTQWCMKKWTRDCNWDILMPAVVDPRCMKEFCYDTKEEADAQVQEIMRKNACQERCGDCMMDTRRRIYTD